MKKQPIFMPLEDKLQYNVNDRLIFEKNDS